MIEKKSSFAGFHDGYKASNIASIEPTLKIHLKEILAQITALLDVLKRKNKSEELIELLKRSHEILNNESIQILERSLSFGETFSIYLDMHKQTIGASDSEINQKVKKIIYNFLTLAEKSEDTNLSSLAIKLGENF